MNKILFAIAVCTSVFASSFGAANDTVLSFSTPGPDRYADGSKVLNGESYALVWTADGATFGGLSSECRTLLATDKLVLVAPLAKYWKCPVTIIEISAADAAQYEGGSFALYLLDTRVRGSDGKISLAAYKDGRPQVVNSLGAADAEDAVASADGVAGSIRTLSSVKLGAVGVYTEIERPTIAAMKIDGAKIKLEVKGTSPAADYYVVPGGTPASFSSALNATLEKKEDSAVFTFEKPEEPAEFYKVIGVRKF